MKRIVMLAMAFVMMLVSLGGCFWGVEGPGRERGGGHDRGGGYERGGDHDRGGGHEERR